MTKSDDPSSLSSTSRRRLWCTALLGVLGAVTVLVAFGLWLLTHLEHPWVRGRVEQALSAAIGTGVRYEGLSISPFSGLEARGLVLETPETLGRHAPEMLRVDELALPIEIGPLLSGEIVVPEIRGGALTVTVVVADDGRTSFGALAGANRETDPDGSAEPPTPLSRSLEVLEDLSLRLGPVRLSPIVIRVVQVAGDAVVTDVRFDAVALTSNGLVLGDRLEGALSLQPDAAVHTTLTVRELEDGEDEPPTREAQLAPRVEARIRSDRTVALSVSIDLAEQSVFPELRPIESLIRLETSARFAPDRAQTRLEVGEVSLLDAMLTGSATAVVDDDHVAVLDGRGTVEVPSLPWALSWLNIENLSGQFEISELRVVPDGVTGGRATVEGRLRAARYADGSAGYELRGARWGGELGAPDSSSRTVGTLELESSIEHLLVKERGLLRASLREIATALVLEDVGADDDGVLGLKGRGSLRGSMDRVYVGAATRVHAKDASLDLDVDLTGQRVEGRVPIQWLAIRPPRSKRIVLRRPVLAVVADEPLRWRGDQGSPSIEVKASAGRVSLGDKHFRAKRWGVDVRRTQPSRYALQSRIRADRISWGKFERDAESSLVVDVDIDSARTALDATAALSVAGGAQTDLTMSASHDADVTRYALGIVGSDAGPLLGWLLFDDGGRPTDELDLMFESRGELRGLLHEDRNGSLVLSKEPLRSLHGSHESKLEVSQASLVRRGITHALGGLRLTATTKHEAPGRGRIDAEVGLDEIRYGEAGWELTVRDYSHRVEAAYAALHGAPSFAIRTRGAIGEIRQPYFRQYPLEKATFGAEVDVDGTQVVAVREAYFRNPAGGTRFEARAAYEGWQEALRDAEVCTVGIEGCPAVTSMYGRESAMITGTFEQDFRFWRSTERTKSGGSFVMPFTIESGDLSTYRVIASAELRDVVLELPQYGLLVDDLDALIPIEQELATTPRFFVVPTSAANAIAQKRFFDLYPFTKRDSFFTVDRVQFGKETLGPVAANLQVVGATLAMDQLHAGYREGFVTGQILGDLSQDDPKVVFRGNVTGIEATDGKGVLDANVAMTFVPTTLIVEGKAQLVRISKHHLYELIDVLDPYHEDEDLNRVRLGLKFGYPKFVRLTMDEGLMNAKIDLGGLAGAVRIDEIRGIPVTPFIEQYVHPYIERLMSPTAAARAMIMENEGT